MSLHRPIAVSGKWSNGQEDTVFRPNATNGLMAYAIWAVLSCPNLHLTLTFRNDQDAKLWMTEFNKMKAETLAALKLDPAQFVNPATSTLKQKDKP